MTTTDHALSATDVAALRKADSVCFDLYLRDGARVSQLRAIKRAPEPTTANPFPSDVTVEIPVGVGVADYGAEALHANGPDRYSAFEMIHSAQYDDTWQTIAGLLRAEDVLSLGWTRDGGNGYVKDAGLHLDSVKLIVTRKGKRLTFNIRSSVCQDNSARMVKLAGQYSLR